MGQKTSVFALFTDDIGFWTDEKRKIRGQADEKPAYPYFYICPFLRAEQKKDRTQGKESI